MPIVSAVLHIDPTRDLGQLLDDPRIDRGPSIGTRHPVVATTDSRLEDKALWRAIERHPAVLHVELAFADFSDLFEPHQVTP